MQEALEFLIRVSFGLYLLALVLRYLLETVGADSYNDISQFLIKSTNPLVSRARRLIPPVLGFDWAVWLLAVLVKTVELLLLAWVAEQAITPQGMGFGVLVHLLELILNIYLLAVFIQVLVNWLLPGVHTPATRLIYALTDPILRRARQVMPTIYGMDLSPIVVLVLIQLLRLLLLPPLTQLMSA